MNGGSKTVERTLAQRDIHDEWIRRYRSADNERFMEMAFDDIARHLKSGRAELAPTPENWTILDAGCGTGVHSVRLAKRGFFVKAVDFSEHVLGEAAERLRTQHPELEQRISFQRETLLDLSFPDASFPFVICWGVLMHIPDIEAATRELARVVKPGGALVIGENNMHSLETTAYRALHSLVGKRSKVAKRTPAGIEYWWTSSAGEGVTRVTDMKWLKHRFESLGLVLQRRVARQFTEVYTHVSSPPVNRLIHAFNNAWFRYVKIPQVALGNLLFFTKRG